VETKTADRLREFLLREWSSGLRLTTVPQAMARLELADDVRLRWRVAKGLEALWRDALTSPEKRRRIAQALGRPFDESQIEQFRGQVGTWNIAAVALSEDEKLVARHILLHQQRGLLLPHPPDTAKALGIPLRKVQRALRVLAKVGFVDLGDGGSSPGYVLTEGHEELLEGLGFMFHTVSLETGEQFGVP